MEIEQLNLNSEDFDVMFGKLPDNTPSADNLIGQEDNKDKGQEGNNPEGNDQEPAELKFTDDEIDMDEAFGIKPAPKKDPKPKTQAQTNPDDADAQAADQEPDNDQDADDTDAEGGIPVDYKAVTDLLIQEGLWEDFQEKDNIKYDDKTFAELWKQQALSVAEGYFNELVDQSGPYGKAVIDWAKNGGNPEEILELFRESKRVQSLDIKTPEGQEQVVREYYKTLKWSNDKIEKEIRKKKEDLELEEESEFAKGQLDERVQNQVKQKQEAEENRIKRQQELEREFSTNITNALKKRSDINDSDKRDALKALLSYDKKLEDGRYVNQFYIDFMKMQSDPNSYIDLVLFVKDKNKYLENVSKRVETNTAVKTFNLIKGNAALSSKKDSGYAKQQSTSKSRDLVISTK